MTNQELLEQINKAVTGTTTGGQLSAQQVSEFLDLVQEQSAILSEMRVEKGIKTSLTIDGIEFAEPSIRAATEATNPDTDDIVAPSMPRLTLSPKRIRMDVDISYEWLYKNVQGAKGENAVDAAIAKRFAMDLINLTFNGDTSLDSSTALNKSLRILDGIIKKALADTSVIDHVIAASPTFGGSGGELSEGLSLLPKQYRDDRSSLMHLMSVSNMDKYEDEIADRQTNAADNVLFGTQAIVQHKRVKILSPYMFPDSNIITTPKRNIVLGFGEDMKFYKQNQHRKQALECTLIADLDVGYVFSNALVLGSKA
jgi:hypothetical protein